MARMAQQSNKTPLSAEEAGGGFGIIIVILRLPLTSRSQGLGRSVLIISSSSAVKEHRMGPMRATVATSL